MAGYLGTKAVLLSTTAANVVGNATIGGDLTVDTDTLYVDSTNNQVGIGTTSPQSDANYAGLTLSDTTGAQVVFQDDGVTEALIWNNNALYLEATGTFPVTVRTNGAERMTIDDSGHVIIPAGVTLGTAAGVYAAANTLDDYEEGTFTPVLSDASTAGNLASVANVRGNYTKTGNQVTVHLNLNNITTTGMTGTNEFYIQGMPFTPPSYTTPNLNYVGTVRMNEVLYSGYAVAEVGDNNSFMAIREVVSGAGAARLLVSDLTSGTADISISLTYETA